MMTLDEENAIIDYMTKDGWKLNVNDEKRLGFTFYEDEKHEWFRDYSKETKRFVQGNERQVINLIYKPNEEPEDLKD